jgi:WD40 repeat protein
MLKFRWIALGLIALQSVALFPAIAEEKSPDAVLNQLMQLPPAEIAAHIATLKKQLAEVESQSKGLKDQAAALDAKRKTVEGNLQPYTVLIKAMAPKPPKTQATPAVMNAGGQTNLNFADHVLPIFEARCMKCHNQDKRKGGLSLATYGLMGDGGSSGEPLFTAGEADDSYIIALITQSEDPIMPPEGKGDPLAADQVDLIRQWIDSGARAQADSKVLLARKEKKVANPVFLAAEFADTPPMPEVGLAAFQSSAKRGLTARAMATSQTAPLLAVGGDRQVLLYDIENMKLLGVLPYAEGEIFSLSFSLNGELLLAAGGIGGKSGTAVVWNVRTGERVGTYGKFYDTLYAADISPDHKMVAVGGTSRKVKVFDAADGELLYEMDKHNDWVYSIKFSPDGELLATADRAGGLYYWQAANGRFVEPLNGHNGPIHDMTYTYDSNIMATAGNDGTVILWDTWKYKQIRKIKAHNGAALSVHYAKNNELITSGKDGVTKKWTNDGKNVLTYPKVADWAYQTRFGASDSLVITGDWNGKLAVWDNAKAEAKSELFTMPNLNAKVAANPTDTRQTD